MTDLTTIQRDPTLELLLERFDQADVARWGPVVAQIDLVDLDPESQVRDIAFDPDVVERYAAALADGARFPAVLLRAVGERWVPVTGRHRIEAHKLAGMADVAAYLAPTMDETTAFAIAVEDNTRHGLPLSNEERCRLGLEFVDMGVSGAEAARRVGLSHNMLDRARLRRQGAIRALAMGVDRSWAGLPASSQARVMNLSDDAVFGMVVSTAAAQRWTTEQVFKLVTELNQTPDNPTEQMMAVGDFELEVERQRDRSPKGANDIGSVRGACLRLSDLDIDRAVEQCRPNDRRATAHNAKRAGMLLIALASKLEAK